MCSSPPLAPELHSQINAHNCSTVTFLYNLFHGVGTAVQQSEVRAMDGVYLIAFRIWKKIKEKMLPISITFKFISCVDVKVPVT